LPYPQTGKMAKLQIPAKAGIQRGLGREAEKQAFMNSPHLDIEKRVGREVRAGEDNLQVIAAERHALTGFGFVERDGRELAADLCLKKSLALAGEPRADFLGALAGHPAVHLVG